MWRKKLREIREEKGIEQKAVAEAIGVTAAFLCYVEQGKRTVDVDRFRDWCKALDVKAHKVLESVEEYLK